MRPDKSCVAAAGPKNILMKYSPENKGSEIRFGERERGWTPTTGATSLHWVGAKTFFSKEKIGLTKGN